MTRETSIEAYQECLARGQITNWQFEVLKVILSKKEGITEGECWSEHFHDKQRHDIGPRFAELKARGLIVELGKRPCRLTGKTVYFWAGTGAEVKPKVEKREPRTFWVAMKPNLWWNDLEIFPSEKEANDGAKEGWEIVPVKEVLR